MVRALIVVDVQNDFIPGGSLAVPEGDRIVPVINSLQSGFDLVVATQDWHPEGHKSFAGEHPGKKPFETIELNGHEQKLWPVHCVQGTEGAGFYKGLETDNWAAIFRKGMDIEVDSYSGFYDNHHLKSTGLAGYLKEKGVTKVYLAGLAADVCVYFTAKDALGEGFEVFYIQDATKAIDNNTFDQLLNELKSLGASIITAAKV